MGEIINGRYISDTESAILDAMMTDAKDVLGDDINDDETAVIRLMYLPVARRFAEVQNNIGIVLDSSQIQHANGKALDFLTALIGVPRKSSQKATGKVQISISSADTVEHTIPKGTEVSTNSSDSIEFLTTESKTLSAGSTSLTVSVRAVEGGTDSNVGANSIVNFPSGSPFPGASVTNPNGTSDGIDREEDNSLRSRAEKELANGARASGPALVSQTSSIKGVYNVTIFINDTDASNGRGNGLPPHSFEIVAATDGGDDTHKEIAQTLMDTKAVGDISVTGQNGDILDTAKDHVTAEGEIYTNLPNDQEHPVGFSLSTTIDVYVDIDIQVTDEYRGDEYVRNEIVEYIGGTETNGSEKDGQLMVGEDVIHAKLKAAIFDVKGVYDINTVHIGKASNPTSTSNITIADFEQAIIEATSGNQHITMSTTLV
jgi:uncharacterized phage protein gp47/JayE